MTAPLAKWSSSAAPAAELDTVIARDLRKEREANASESVANASPAALLAPLTGSPETKQHREEVAAAAAEDGVTDEPDEKYRIIYADMAHASKRYPRLTLRSSCHVLPSRRRSASIILTALRTSPSWSDPSMPRSFARTRLGDRSAAALACSSAHKRSWRSSLSSLRLRLSSRFWASANSQHLLSSCGEETPGRARRKLLRMETASRATPPAPRRLGLRLRRCVVPRLA